MTSLILAALFAAQSVSAAPKASFRVLSVEGGALTSDGKPAAAGQVLPDGAALHLTAGHATLDFGGEGKLLLTGPADMKVAVRGVELTLGGLLNVFPKLKNGFKVRTRNAVAAVRGTNFYIEARGADATYVCLCSGRIVVSATDESSRTEIKSKTHSAHLFSGSGKTLAESKAPMAGHSDAQIAALLKP